MYIAILGRQPTLGLAELESLYSADNVELFGDGYALVQADTIALERLGGTVKAGVVVAELSGDWQKVSRALVRQYSSTWSSFDGKITLGISAYGFDVSPRAIQKTGIVLKQKLKQSGVSVRLLPNTEPALGSASSHHNKLGLANNKVELLVVRNGNEVIVAESVGAQNISAYAARDQGRPKRDAFVGMLPPKLAQIMVNLAIGSWKMEDGDASQIPIANSKTPIVLDPFCGTGVILQEAALMGYAVCGTDLAEKMVRYSRDNLNWLQENHSIRFGWYLHEGDAMTTKWQPPISAVVSETYLGQPFSAPPSPAKLREVRGNCNHIISAFLSNLAPQLESGTPLCIAIPAWKDSAGRLAHLPLTEKLDSLGFSQHQFKNTPASKLLYYRDDQVVARELLVLIKK